MLIVLKRYDLTLITCLVLPIVSYIIGVVFRTIIIKKFNKDIKENIGGILLFDLFLLTWVPVNLVCLFKKECNWDQIKHNRNVGDLSV